MIWHIVVFGFNPLSPLVVEVGVTVLPILATVCSGIVLRTGLVVAGFEAGGLVVPSTHCSQHGVGDDLCCRAADNDVRDIIVYRVGLDLCKYPPL